MSPRGQRVLLLACLMLIAAALCCAGIHWGLPSRQVDPFLFGDHPVWSGQQIMSLTGQRSDDAHLGADVPRHPLQNRDQILVLNDTDVARAEIIRRYRLYSAQPDESTLLIAISRMRPAKLDFDPRFYQYGGLFIYPLAALLKVASIQGIYLKLTPDIAFYIDHPEEFARFYVVGRAWAGAWCLVGVWAVFTLTRRFTGGLWCPGAAALAFILLPVVINQAHEAKPHLQGAVLILCAVLAACRYVETGHRKRAWLAGAVCGGAVATVLTAIVAFAVLPVMVCLRPMRLRERLSILVIAGGVGIAVYFVTNPCVAINLVRNRDVLRSNLGNSAGMYRGNAGASGLTHGLFLIGEGASPGLAVAGGFSALVAAIRGLLARRRGNSSPPGGRFAAGSLLAAPLVPLLIQFLTYAAGKPAEYGRFALYIDTVFTIAAISASGLWLRNRPLAFGVVMVLLCTTAFFGLNYLKRFSQDAAGDSTRWEAAEALRRLTQGRPISIAVWAEPAPYAVPPIDLFRNELRLLPRGYDPTGKMPAARILIRATDDPRTPEPWAETFDQLFIGTGRPSQISWANKPFILYVVPSN